RFEGRYEWADPLEADRAATGPLDADRAAAGSVAPGRVAAGTAAAGSVTAGSMAAGPIAPDPAPPGAGPARVLPVITGRAHVTAEGVLLVDPEDEFAWGIGSAGTSWWSGGASSGS